jgi:hypothetical protein
MPDVTIKVHIGGTGTVTPATPQSVAPSAPVPVMPEPKE